MPADFAAQDAAIAALLAQVAQQETTEQSSVDLINGFAAQVTAAIAADNSIDNAATAAAAQQIETIRARFEASRQKVDAAVQTVPKPAGSASTGGPQPS